MEENPEEDSGIANSVSEPPHLKCDKCGKVFNHLKGLKHHVLYTCKAIPGPVIINEPRIRPNQLVAIRLTVNPELDSLLSTIDSDYVRWRLSLAAKVTQSDTFPVLFKYKRRGFVSKCCPVSDPYKAMYNVLVDARNNYQVDKIEMPKKLVVVDSDGETEMDVSEFLLPSRQHSRSNRPMFHVEESPTSIIYSLTTGEVADDPVANALIPDDDLEISMREISLQDDSNVSIGTSDFAPR